jgi:hypothetical protein
MNILRVNKRIANWANNKASNKCRNWFYNVFEYFAEHNLNVNLNTPIRHGFVKRVNDAAMEAFISAWRMDVNSIVGPSGRGRNKLRTYRTFKKDYGTEQYCKLILPPRHRAAFAKFRCGVAPLRIETGRYEGLSVADRLCPFCNNVETEEHVILECHMYTDLRNELFQKATTLCSTFNQLCNQEKLIMLFSNFNMIRISAKTCFYILQRRTLYICK